MPDTVQVALALALRNGRVLAGKRLGDPAFPEHWEFPGGKIEPGETAAAAARRELLEETGLDTAALQPLVRVEHTYTDRTVTLHCFLSPEPVGSPLPGWSWFTPQELESLPMPEANGKILDVLRTALDHG